MLIEFFSPTLLTHVVIPECLIADTHRFSHHYFLALFLCGADVDEEQQEKTCSSRRQVVVVCASHEACERRDMKKPMALKTRAARRESHGIKCEG